MHLGFASVVLRTFFRSWVTLGLSLAFFVVGHADAQTYWWHQNLTSSNASHFNGTWTPNRILPNGEYSWSQGSLNYSTNLPNNGRFCVGQNTKAIEMNSQGDFKMVIQPGDTGDRHYEMRIWGSAAPGNTLLNGHQFKMGKTYDYAFDLQLEWDQAGHAPWTQGYSGFLVVHQAYQGGGPNAGTPAFSINVRSDGYFWMKVQPDVTDGNTAKWERLLPVQSGKWYSFSVTYRPESTTQGWASVFVSAPGLGSSGKIVSDRPTAYTHGLQGPQNRFGLYIGTDWRQHAMNVPLTGRYKNLKLGGGN